MPDINCFNNFSVRINKPNFISFKLDIPTHLWKELFMRVPAAKVTAWVPWVCWAQTGLKILFEYVAKYCTKFGDKLVIYIYIYR